MDLKILGRVTSASQTLRTGISDLEIVSTSGGIKLVSVSGPEGGVAAYRLRDDAVPVKEGHAYFAANQVSGAGHDLIFFDDGGTTRVQVSGVSTNAITSYSLNSQGNFGDKETLGGSTIGSAAPVAARTESGKILLADPSKPGFSVYDSTGNGPLTDEHKVTDTTGTYAQSVGDIATVRIGSTDIAVVASQSEFGVTSYVIGNGQPVAGDSIGRPEGLGIMVPTDIETAQISGRHYVIVASEPSEGSSGALSVMRLDANGDLTPTDHVIDTRASRFGDVQKIATLSHDGHTYVVAGGSDNGLTLLELLPNGQLIHLDSIAGTNSAPLDDITAIEMAVVGGELQIFVATESREGITVLDVEISDRGSTRVAGNSGQTLNGNSEDEFLVDGTGSDTLRGGGGSDTFVLVNDGETDRILDFNPANDKLDLSGFAFLYDVDDLQIASTSNGANITHRDETIILKSHNGAPLNTGAVRNTVELNINRSFVPPSMDIEGTDGADSLVGSWGSDTLSGFAGDDTLEAGEGGDVVEAGAGGDRLHGGSGGDTLNGADGNDTIYGESGSDVISGGEHEDLIFGQSGNDEIDGEDHADSIDGGSGRDTLFGGGGNDTLIGGTNHDRAQGDAGDDVLNGDDGNDTLFGGADHDRLHGGAGRDSLDGGIGDDVAYGGDGSDTIYGQSNNDLLFGESDSDKLVGGLGNDTLWGGGHADSLYGGGGDDELYGESGSDWMRGEDGNDSHYGSTGDDTILGGSGDDTIYGEEDQDQLFGGGGHDLLYGGSGNDLLWGGDNDDLLYGNDGNDEIDGDSGSDKIWGGSSRDRLYGGSHNDTILGDSGYDSIYGESGNDQLFGGNGKDFISGGDGNDTLWGGARQDSLYGSDGDDELYGESSADRMRGGSGNDRLYGGSNKDTIYGDAGSDTIYGEKGKDKLYGGSGRDFISGGSKNDTIRGGEYGDSLYGSDGNDSIDGDSGSDRIRGGSGKDRLYGGSHNDTILGDSGRDSIHGESGHDSIKGGSGKDTIAGGSGNDILAGGSGADRFVFKEGYGRDTISDFNAREDRLRIDSDFRKSGMSKQDFVDRYARRSGDNIELRFDDGDTLVLAGFTDMGRLDNVIDFI